MTPNPPAMLMAKLLFKSEPIIDADRLFERLKLAEPNIDNAKTDDHCLLFAFPDYVIQFTDGAIPAQLTLMKPAQSGIMADEFKQAVVQSWHWRGAGEMLSECKYELLITDLMSRALDGESRVALFNQMIMACVRELNPAALCFLSADKLIDPAEFLKTMESDRPDKLYGFLNVRFYRVTDGAEGEMAMDTLGLHVFGLPDFQIRFRGYSPQAVSSLLFNYAYFLFSQGNVIKDGDTIQGINPDEIWRCALNTAWIAPERMVLTIETNQ